MDRQRKEALKELLEKLDTYEHEQLFKIVEQYTNVYTKTEHGAFVSSDMLSTECLLEMEKMVYYFLEQRKRFANERR